MVESGYVSSLVKRQLEPQLHQLPVDAQGVAKEVVDELCKAHRQMDLHVLTGDAVLSQDAALNVVHDIEQNKQTISDAEFNLRIALTQSGVSSAVAAERAHHFLEAAERAYGEVLKKNFLSRGFGSNPEEPRGLC